jgi:hypothetical protein
MTTFIAFTPSKTASPPFSTSVTLDGNSFGLTCFWNLYRTGWYYQLTDQNGNIVITAALVGSPLNADVYLAPGLLTASTLLYRADTGNFEASP